MMLHARQIGRRGITLTEILIGIMLIGVGVPSLMTLFLLGMLNGRQATRYSRSGFLAESARAELGTRNLLSKSSFLNSFSGQWYNKPFAAVSYDPWVQDTPAYGTSPMSGGAYRGSGSYTSNGVALPAGGFIAGPGLPVAYDPLWRMTTPPPVPLGANPKVGYFLGAPSEARFASGLGFVRPDPNPANAATGDASAHGLQRLTNFPYVDVFPYVNVATVNSIFVSPEDMVLQSDSESGTVGSSSPIVPDLNLVPLKDTPYGLPVIQNDWKYTWMFTGYQADATNGTIFMGDIVIFENRPFAVDPAPTYFTPSLATGGIAAGETVVEAVFGHTNNVTFPLGGGPLGYGSKAGRAVLLRWSAAMPDPEIKAGSWIADVTYERNAVEDNQRAVLDPTTGKAGAFYPYQRCHWYQVAKRTEAGPAANKFTGDAAAGMREMTVWTSTQLQAFTLLNSGGEPYHVNAALVSPYVVNVFQRTIQTR